MINIMMLVAMFVLGGCIGLVYFGGLWLTVILVNVTRRRAVLLTVSSLLRMAGAMACFYLILRQGTAALGAAVLGFVAARAALIGRIKEIPKPENSSLRVLEDIAAAGESRSGRMKAPVRRRKAVYAHKP